MNLLRKFGLIILATLFLLSACESDEETSVTQTAATPTPTATATISGTAAGGAPVVGIVNVLGVNGNSASADIGADGKYSLDVTALTPPYILYAEGTVSGQSVRIYSTGVAAGAINITPITNLITTKLLGTNPDDVVDQWASASAVVDATAIASAETAVEEQLAPILEAAGLTGDVDLMSVDFDADHSGMDAVLDVIKIDATDPENVSVTNTVTGTTVTGEDTFSAEEATATEEILEKRGSLNDFFETVTTLYADSKPTADELHATIAPFIAEDYLDNGRTKLDELECWANDDDCGPDIGLILEVTMLNPLSADELPAAYSEGYWVKVHYTFGANSGSFKSAMVFNGTDWLWYGNQRPVEIRILSEMSSASQPDGDFFWTGLSFRIDDDDNKLWDQGIRSVIVTGAGLPASGLVFEHGFPRNYFRIVGSDEYGGEFYDMTDDAVIAEILPNSTYRVTFYNETADVVSLSDTAIYTVSESIEGRPPLNADMTADIFPTFTSYTSFDFNEFPAAGSTITLSWKNSSNTIAKGGAIFFGDNENQFEADADVENPGDESVSLEVPSYAFEPNYIWFGVWGKTLNGISFNHNISYWKDYVGESLTQQILWESRSTRH